MMPVVAVIGTSKSGKTTLIEYLLSTLSGEGLRVGTIKHVHRPEFSIDVEEKDTWRHSRAGAKVVVYAAPKEIAVIKKREGPNEKLEEVMGLVEGEKLDLLILEGFHSLVAKRGDIPKIVTAKDEVDLKRTLEGTVDPILAITGPFAREGPSPPGVAIPILDLNREGKEILGLIRAVIKK